MITTMTYYCEKCGHKLDENERRCAFCGAVQKRFSDQDYETKKCKKCGKDIYVNANFCPYCGTDQAILNLNEDLKRDDADQKTTSNSNANLTSEQKLAQGLMNTNFDDQDSLNNFMKQMQDAGIKVRVIKPEEKNETGKPGLIASTKLFFRDMFKINKRLGVNDFWWGFFGFFLICMVAAMLLSELLPFFKIPMTMKTMFKLSAGVSVVFRLGVLTAIIRRLHDIQMPAWFVILWFIPIAQFFIWFICMMGPRLDNNPYTFNVEDWKKRQNKF